MNAFSQVFDRTLSKLGLEGVINWICGMLCVVSVFVGLYSSPSDTQQLAVIGIALTLIVIARRVYTTSTPVFTIKSILLVVCFQALGIGIGGFIHDQFTTLY